MKRKVMLPDPLHDEMRLTLAQMQLLTGLGRTAIYRYVNAGKLPQPEREGPRFSRWRYGDYRVMKEKRRAEAQHPAASAGVSDAGKRFALLALQRKQAREKAAREAASDAEAVA